MRRTMESQEAKEQQKPLFRDINADDDDTEITEMESLCMQCEENGRTRMLLTKIPFFKEIIIMSFECPHCNFRDNEIKAGSMIQEKGLRLTLTVTGKEFLDRQVVKQACAKYRIEEIDFEAPPYGSKGVLTTLEGLLQAGIDGLQAQQPVRKITQPDIAAKIDNIITKIEEYKAGTSPFTFTLEDVSGNSFMENPSAPLEDPHLKTEWFERTKKEDESLGMFEPEVEEDETHGDEVTRDEVMEFPSNCPSCQSSVSTKMKIIDIPHFKEMIIMATACDACGFKSNEVKAGGAMEAMGTKIIFNITDASDLNRDVLTAETCTVNIPDLELELHQSSMGGKFTTLEGLLTNVKEQLSKVNPFAIGDSAAKHNKLKTILEKLGQVISGDLFVTIILDDPVGNSYLQNTYAPDTDPELTVEKYERTKEQNDDLGISLMNTENYS